MGCMRRSIHRALAIHTLVGHLLECAQKVDPLSPMCVLLFRLLCLPGGQRPDQISLFAILHLIFFLINLKFGLVDLVQLHDLLTWPPVTLFCCFALTPANSVFLSHHSSSSLQPPASQQYFSLTPLQQQPPAPAQRTGWIWGGAINPSHIVANHMPLTS